MNSKERELTLRLIDGCEIAEFWAMGIIDCDDAIRAIHPEEYIHQIDISEYVPEDRSGYYE